MAGRMRTAEEEAWRRKTSDPVPVPLLSGDRESQDKVDATAELDAIRNSMKMKHSQKNCLIFVQNIEIIAEQKNQPGKHDSEADFVVNSYEGVRIVMPCLRQKLSLLHLHLPGDGKKGNGTQRSVL